MVIMETRKSQESGEVELDVMLYRSLAEGLVNPPKLKL